ncbi:MAG: ATP-binding protein [Planctomycetota bacterium]|nr:ATP-binding protein [Planctomycetota bacterium]
MATHRAPWPEFGGVLLAGLGETLGAQRVALLEFERSRRMVARLRFEWRASDSRSRPNLGAPASFDLEELGLQAWHTSLSEGRNVLSDTARLATARHAGLIADRTHTFVLAPVLAGTRLWGALLVEAFESLSALEPESASAVSIVGDALAISLLREEREQETQSSMARGVAHDLCNMLQVAGGTFELLALGFDETTRQQQGSRAHLVSALEQSLQQGTSLARRLLELSTAPEGRPRDLDIAAHLRESASLWSQAVGPRVRLSIESDSSDSRIRLDPTLFDQVLLNLIVNARDAMPEGGTLALSVTSRESATTPPTRRVVLRVRDTGTGIASHVRERIFEPLFTTKPSGRGSGLGLSTVAAIVRRAGGGIEVHSAPGLGTEFVLDFPACTCVS